MPVAGHEGRGVHGFADGPLADALDHGLDTGPHEGVRRASDAAIPLCRRLDEPLAGFPVVRQGFLAVHVLTRFEGGQADRSVGGGGGKVQHEVDRRVGEERFGVQHLRHVEPAGL